jgi:putative membrane protein
VGDKPGDMAPAGRGEGRAPLRFHDAEAKGRSRETVTAVEARTAAEVVIAVRPASGTYRHADFLFGFVLSVVVLLLLLYLPVDFPLWSFPLDVAGTFLLGTLASAALPPLRRLLVPSRERRENVRRAARAAFVTLGIHRTRGRNGLLVYASLFERHVELVSDVGIVPALGGTEWRARVDELGSSLAGGADAGRFLAAVAALAGPLERMAPRAADDVNELPDERVSQI